MDARLLEHVRTHDQIRVPVASGICAIRADASHLRGEVEHELRLHLVEETRRLRHVGEIEVLPSRRGDMMTLGLEPLHEA